LLRPDRGDVLGALLPRVRTRSDPVDARRHLRQAGSRPVGHNFQTHKWWIFFGAFAMIVLMTAILLAGTRMVFRWQNTFWAIPTGPWYHFIASLVYNNDVLTILIVGSFAFWSLPAMVGNTFMPVRTVFAWAFDRLLPERFADVDERRHAPVPAILLVMGIVTLMLLWSVEKTTFQTWLALGVLAGVVCVWIVSIAAFLFPDRRPDLYEASPANISVGGIPLLKIVSPLSFLAMAFLVYDTLKYPALA